MDTALNKVLASLPDDTKVYVSLPVDCLVLTADKTFKPGHEYTKGNAKFGLHVTQDSAVKKLESFANDNKQTQGKSTIGDEKVH